MNKTEKIQKILAREGYGSRRLIEAWIQTGRVRINNRVAILGDRAGPHDSLYVDGKPCNTASRLVPARVLIYNKPIGIICSRHDPEGRPTIFEQLPSIDTGRWIQVGRLDINTSGLLLLTNDGELANQLMHPSSQFTREYVVRVRGIVEPSVLTRLQQGVMLEDGMAKFDELIAREQGSHAWYQVTVREGRNRLVRRLWESQGLTVSRLKRIAFGPVRLPRSLKLGNWLELESSHVKLLRDTR